MASGLKEKIEGYWSKIEDVTLDAINSIKGDEGQSNLLLRNRFKDFFIRSTNLR